MPLQFPGDKRFAFTVFDDTDVATLDSIRPVYELLFELGLMTTKTVWPLDYTGPSSYAGSATLQDPQYCEYLRLLQSRGFEIAFHGSTMETAARSETERALQIFRREFGKGPSSYAAHAQNRDNPYWGRDRFQFGVFRLAYQLWKGRHEPRYEGHVPGSDVYWLDLAPELRYVRSLTYAGVDLNRVTSRVPYRSKRTPGVKAWFPSCDADNVEEFVALLSAVNQDALERNRGVCILSTHFGKGFIRDGRVRPDVARALESLSRRRGWFVPVTPLLDHLAQQRGIAELSGPRLFWLEALWFAHSLLRKLKERPYEPTEVPFLEAGQRAQAERQAQRSAP